MTTLTVKDLRKFLSDAERQGRINNDTEVWLSSDEEGNSYSPLCMIKTNNRNKYNIGFERDKSKVTFYPVS